MDKLLVIFSLYLLILGSSQITVASIFISSPPSFLRMSRDFSKKTALSIFFHFLSLGGKWMPISPFDIEPRIASVIEWSKTSASECPINPYWWSISMPPRTNLEGFEEKAWTSNPDLFYIPYLHS